MKETALRGEATEYCVQEIKARTWEGRRTFSRMMDRTAAMKPKASKLERKIPWNRKNIRRLEASITHYSKLFRQTQERKARRSSRSHSNVRDRVFAVFHGHHQCRAYEEVLLWALALRMTQTSKV